MMLLSTIPAALCAVLLLAAADDSRHPSRFTSGRAQPLLSTHLAEPRDSTPLYTEEQAVAGAALYGRVCAECHEKKDVTSADFKAKWGGRPIYDLFELIRTTMPDSNPGGFSRDEYAGALAYILKLNGLPSGATPVMPDSAAMQNQMLVFPPPPPPPP